MYQQNLNDPSLHSRSSASIIIKHLSLLSSIPLLHKTPRCAIRFSPNYLKRDEQDRPRTKLTEENRQSACVCMCSREERREKESKKRRKKERKKKNRNENARRAEEDRAVKDAAEKPTVRRLGLNLTDSVVALPARLLPGDVLRPLPKA
ncbi:hypothetical protein ANTRET_LOCUS6647 [Anthophora retusa]